MLSLCSYSTLPLDEEAEIIDDGTDSDESDSIKNVHWTYLLKYFIMFVFLCVETRLLLKIMYTPPF